MSDEENKLQVDSVSEDFLDYSRKSLKKLSFNKYFKKVSRNIIWENIKTRTIDDKFLKIINSMPIEELIALRLVGSHDFFYDYNFSNFPEMLHLTKKMILDGVFRAFSEDIGHPRNEKNILKKPRTFFLEQEKRKNQYRKIKRMCRPDLVMRVRSGKEQYPEFKYIESANFQKRLDILENRFMKSQENFENLLNEDGFRIYEISDGIKEELKEEFLRQPLTARAQAARLAEKVSRDRKAEKKKKSFSDFMERRKRWIEENAKKLSGPQK